MSALISFPPIFRPLANFKSDIYFIFCIYLFLFGFFDRWINPAMLKMWMIHYLMWKEMIFFRDLGDLGKLAEMNEDGFNFSSSHKGNHSLDQWPPADSFLELRDLDHPLKITVEGSGSGFVPPGGVCMDCDCCNNSEHFDHPFNDFGVRHHASASIPNPPVLADRSYGFENLMDVFSKVNYCSTLTF